MGRWSAGDKRQTGCAIVHIGQTRQRESKPLSLFGALSRHPLPVLAHFDHSLVVTFGLPPEQVRPLLPAGLDLEIYRSPEGDRFALVAVAAVSLRQLRLPYLPRLLGLRTIMTGYRIFARYQTPGGRILRGLRHLRNDADNALLTRTGNLLTDFDHQRIHAWTEQTDGQVRFVAHSADGTADVDIVADLAEPEPHQDAVFETPDDARRYAGPRGYTFSPGGDGGIVVVRTYRSDWEPRQVAVDVRRASFFQHGPFAGTKPILASAYYMSDLNYGWHRGRLRPARAG
ncbi:DUF2071 domain-containing protein [Fodinicola feengrottensis]|uniref:DUF2071 domain-containing protein n=1 Tax=Fodinicola feengrottensis TaxID=435914 RepID=UPI0031D2B95B